MGCDPSGPSDQSPQSEGLELLGVCTQSLQTRPLVVSTALEPSSLLLSIHGSLILREQLITRQCVTVGTDIWTSAGCTNKELEVR